MGVLYTALSRKVVAKTVHATIPKGNMDMINTLVPDTVAVESTFVAFLSGLQITAGQRTMSGQK